MRIVERWKQQARRLKRETYAVYLAMRDPRVPWYAKAVAACVAGYAFSPLDLIPDFIPVLGYLDDLIIVPLGVALVVKLIPPSILAECRERATAAMQEKATNWVAVRIATGVIVAVWLLVAALCIVWVLRAVGG